MLRVWHLLHDGSVVAIEGSVPGDLTIVVEIAYLRCLLPEPGDRFLVRLIGCSLLEYHRFLIDQTLIGDFTDNEAEEPEILDARLADQAVVLAMTVGAGTYRELWMRYQGLSVTLEDGRPVAIEELVELAERSVDELN